MGNQHAGAALRQASADGDLETVRRICQHHPQAATAAHPRVRSFVPCRVRQRAGVGLVGGPSIVSVLTTLRFQRICCNASQTKATALHYAAYNGHLTIVEFLYGNGADIDATTSVRGHSRFGACGDPGFLRCPCELRAAFGLCCASFRAVL